MLYCTAAGKRKMYEEDEDSSLLLLSVFVQYSQWVDRIIDGNNNSSFCAVLYCSWKEETHEGEDDLLLLF